MQIRFSRPEYWLLDSVIERTYPVGGLLSPRQEELFNKRPHGISRDSIIEALTTLQSKGFLTFFRPRESETDLQLSRDALASALDEGLPRREEVSAWDELLDRRNYRLTSAGGAAWEWFASPDWNRFILHYSSGDGHEEVTCADERHLDGFLENHAAAFGPIDPTRIVRTTVDEWEPTYWKKLPSGFRVEFFWTPTAPNSSNFADWRARQLRESGFFRSLDNWCQWP